MADKVKLQVEKGQYDSWWAYYFTHSDDPLIGYNASTSTYISRGPDKIEINEYNNPQYSTPLFVAACKERGHYSPDTNTDVRNRLLGGCDVNALLAGKDAETILSKIARTIYVDDNPESVKYATEVLLELFKFFPNPHNGDRDQSFTNKVYQSRVGDISYPFFKAAYDWLINGPPHTVPAGFQGVLLKHLHFRANGWNSSGRFKITTSNSKDVKYINCEKNRYGNADNDGILLPCGLEDTITFEHAKSGPTIKAEVIVNSVVINSLHQEITTRCTLVLKKGSNLLAMDSNGKSDPYVIIEGSALTTSNMPKGSAKKDTFKSKVTNR